MTPASDKTRASAQFTPQKAFDPNSVQDVLTMSESSSVRCKARAQPLRKPTLSKVQLETLPRRLRTRKLPVTQPAKKGDGTFAKPTKLPSKTQSSQNQSESTKTPSRSGWSKQEDITIFNFVIKHGAKKWSEVAQLLGNDRQGKQIRERWHNFLNPLIKKSDWTREEEWILFLLHRASPNKWADMAKIIEGRTDNTIKNHWNSAMKRKTPEMTFALETFVKKVAPVRFEEKQKENA